MWRGCVEKNSPSGFKTAGIKNKYKKKIYIHASDMENKV